MPGLFAQNPSGGQYLFILDGSGSMWQKIGSDYKVTLAKSVMKNLVQKLPADARAGLIAYGHTRKDDCNDIETLAALGPLDKTALQARLDAINPQGKTPIAMSINHALALIRPETAPVTIILVSDGLETCEGDACDLVRKAREQGVKITLHVVGFGIEEKDLSTLECIAQAGGGRYFPANNANELADALDQTVEEPVKEGGYLSVKVTQNGNLLDAMVKVFKKGEKKDLLSGRTYSGKETNPRVLLLPAGDYEAEVMAIPLDGKPTQRLTELKIAMNDTLVKEVDFAKGTFEILVTRNGALSDATIRLLKSGTKEAVAQGRSYRDADHNPARYQVLPGLYDIEISSVEIEDRPVVLLEKQLLTGEARISLSHNYPSGELKVGARQGSVLVDVTVGIHKKKGGASVAAGRTYQSDSSNPKTFILEPGEYEVRLNPVKPKGLAPKKMTVTVTEKGTTTVTGEW